MNSLRDLCVNFSLRYLCEISIQLFSSTFFKPPRRRGALLFFQPKKVIKKGLEPLRRFPTEPLANRRAAQSSPQFEVSISFKRLDH
jgi:hypothetical protein